MPILTATEARKKTQAAIKAALEITDDQIAVKYSSVFNLINTAAENQQSSLDVTLNAEGMAQLVPLLKKQGFSITEKPISSLSGLAGPTSGAFSSKYRNISIGSAPLVNATVVTISW